MEEISEDQLQEMVAELNAGGIFTASLTWSFDLEGKVASELYGIFSYGWSDRKHRVEFCSENQDLLGAAIDTLLGLSNLKEMS